MKLTRWKGHAGSAFRAIFPVSLLLALGGAQAQPDGARPESEISRLVQHYGDCVAASLEKAPDLGRDRFDAAATSTCAGYRSRIQELIRDERALDQIDRLILEHLRGQSDVPHGTVIRRPER